MTKHLKAELALLDHPKLGGLEPHRLEASQPEQLAGNEVARRRDQHGGVWRQRIWGQRQGDEG